MPVPGLGLVVVTGHRRARPGVLFACGHIPGAIGQHAMTGREINEMIRRRAIPVRQT
jgi:glycine/D-amino acid oxidase-like deaminating enzyme